MVSCFVSVLVLPIVAVPVVPEVVVAVVPEVEVAVVWVAIVPDVSVEVPEGIADVLVLAVVSVVDIVPVVPLAAVSVVDIVELVAVVSVVAAVSVLAVFSFLHAKPKSATQTTVKITRVFFMNSIPLSMLMFVLRMADSVALKIKVPSPPPSHSVFG